jgi:ankyrin repeat protein/tRNA A-37 threonylcarbamoyl transferase component Bud32
MENRSKISEEESLFQTGVLIAGRYQVVAPLGKGGMGMVLRVIDRSLDDEPTALKILYPHHVKDQVLFARFRNEVLVARALAHPNIVRLYDFGSAGKGYYFISMEYVQGYSLKDRIYSPHYEDLSFPEICRILYEIGSGLSYAHRKGIIHRDIKPDNILLTPGGEVKITDFGLARSAAMDKGFTQTGETVGTPCYMAPEQISGSRVDARADIYSLGILAYEMATGMRPFEDESWYALAKMHMTKPLPSFARDHNIPQWFEDLVKQSAAKDPHDRFANGEEWCEELASHVQPGTPARKLSPAVFSTTLTATLTNQRRRKLIRGKLIKTLAPMLAGALLFVTTFIAIRAIPSLQLATISTLSGVERALGLNLNRAKRLAGVQGPITLAALDKAVQSQDIHTAKLLLAAGLDISQSEAGKDSPIFRAIDTQQNEIIRAVTDKKGFVSLKDLSGRTPLLRAAEKGVTGIIPELVKSGASIDERDSLGRTALMLAALSGQLASTQEILSNRPMLSLTDTTSDATPISIHAVNGGNPQVLADILDKGGASIANATDSKNRTALMIAAEQGNKEMVKVLLAHNADTERRSADGKTARDIASSAVKKFLPTSAKLSENSSTGRESTPTKVANTRLRKSDPEVQWILGRTPKLSSLQVTVRNVGEERAEEIRIEAILPGGQTLPLAGPESLGANTIATYKALLSSPISVTAAEKPDIELSCANCRK